MGEIRLHGRGGQGTVTAAEMLANAFVIGGRYASVFPSFGVERRGSPVMAFARYGDAPVRERTRVYRPDILLMLDSSLSDVRTNYDGFRTGGTVIANARRPDGIVGLQLPAAVVATVDATTIALESTRTAVTNTCMLGAFARTTGLVELDQLKEALGSYFTGALLAKNTTSLERGFAEVQIARFEWKPAATSAGATDAEPFVAPPKNSSPFASAWSDVSARVVTARTGDWRWQQPYLHDRAACRQCGWCNLYCPLGAMQDAGNGYYAPNLEYCKGCGVCVTECPAHALSMRPEEKPR